MKKILSVLLLSTILYSCQKSTDDNTGIPANGKTDSNFVSLGEAVVMKEAVAVTISSLGTANSIDNLGQNEKGEGFAQQSVENKELKKRYWKLKKINDFGTTTRGIYDLPSAIKSPAQTVSTILDAQSTIQNAKEII